MTKLLLKKLTQYLDEKFSSTPINLRKKLFNDLESWAKEEMNEECCVIFLSALYNAKSTQEVQMEIALDKAVKTIK